VNYEILIGNCLDKMRELDPDSIDSIVTDPPYGLEFMGKEWDHGIPAKDFWIEAIRVAKPGAHLLAFGGTRTYHRLACAIEDAGWEIRDCIMWVYGSGFPKSHDVSKAIDKRRASNEVIRPWLKSLGTREALASACGVTTRQIDHYLGENTPCPQTLPEDKFVMLCEKFGKVPDWAEDMYEAIGEKLGHVKHARSGGDDFAKRPNSVSSSRVVDITAPATEAAKQWQGWGTALKPAWEPIIVARKPLCGTVAKNVLRHGTGAINVDGCRVELNGDYKCGANGRPSQTGLGDNYDSTKANQHSEVGRFPANLIHDGSDEVVGLFPSVKAGVAVRGNQTVSHFGTAGSPQGDIGYGDRGSAARFFYCAKASKADRDEGCEGLEERKSGMSNGAQLNGEGYDKGQDIGLNRVISPRNYHPTVKPTALMRYLCRLVTQPNGIVLDPFMGSGSTGKAAMLEGFRFVGIEMNPEYAEIAKHRIDHAASSMVNNDLKGLFE